LAELELREVTHFLRYKGLVDEFNTFLETRPV